MQRMKGVEVPVIFVRFTANLVSYGLKQVLDVDWKSPFQEPNGKAFEETICMAAVVFRHRHINEFNDNITQCPIYIFEDCANTLEYVQEFIDNNFKGVAPIMEFIVYCAFILDLTVTCVIEDKKEYIREIVEETYDVYEDHIKPYFQLIGGWYAFMQVAQQYLEFVRDMRLYSDMVKGDSAAAATANDSHVDDSILNIEYHTDREDSSRSKGSSRASATCTSAENYPSASANYDMELDPNDKDSDVNDGARCDDTRVSASVTKVAQSESATANDSHLDDSILNIKYHTDFTDSSRLKGSSRASATCTSAGNDPSAPADYDMELDPNDKDSDVNDGARCDDSRVSVSVPKVAQSESATANDSQVKDSILNIEYHTDREYSSRMNGSSRASATCTSAGNDPSASADYDMEFGPNDKDSNVNDGDLCDDSRVSASVTKVAQSESATASDSRVGASIFSDEYHVGRKATANGSRLNGSSHSDATRSSDGNDSNMEVDSNGKGPDVNGSARANHTRFTGSANGNDSSTAADSYMDVDSNDKELNVNNSCDDSRVSGSVIGVHSLRSVNGNTNNTSVCSDSHVNISVHDKDSPMSSSGVSNKKASDYSNMRVVESAMMTPK